MRVLRLFLRRAPLQMLVATLSGAVAGTLCGALIALLRAAAASGVPSARSGAVFAAVCVALFGFDRFARVALFRLLHAKVLPEFRQSLVAMILAAPLKRYEAAGPGRLIGALTEDTAQVGFAATGWLIGARSMAAIVATMIYLAVLAPSSFPIVLGALVVAVGLFVILSAASHRASARARRAQEAAMNDVRTMVSALKELQVVAPRREAFFAESLEPHVREAHRGLARSGALGAVASAWSSIALLGALGVLLFVWPARSMAPELLAGYALAFVFLQGELIALLDVAAFVRGGEEALRSIEELHLDPEPTSSEPGRSSFRAIELRGVTHSYRREDVETDFTLGPLDVTVSPGELVFIVGGNGSGKSTLAKLLVGLYAPESGSIAVDGEAVTSDRIERYRGLFTAILSDWHVFDRLYGLAAADLDVRANECIAKLCLDRKVTVEEGAFSNLDLSQGQRKRLALVTAYLEDRPVCVFDEWASDQDPVFKEVFYRTLLPELRARGRTALVISHDDAYFDVADRVLRLEDGRIVPA